MNGQMINPTLVNKCFAIIAAKDTVDSLLYVVDALSDQIKETPLFVQLINEEDEKAPPPSLTGRVNRNTGYKVYNIPNYKKCHNIHREVFKTDEETCQAGMEVD